MVARGDLGVDVPLEEVPHIQKEVIRQARRRQGAGDRGHPDAGVDDHAARPTRAEVADVTTAIFDGADAIMLSAETASGRFPAQAVETHGAHRRAGPSRPWWLASRRRGATRRAGFAEPSLARRPRRRTTSRPRHRGLHRDRGSPRA